jgi:hypothetical protein
VPAWQEKCYKGTATGVHHLQAEHTLCRHDGCVTHFRLMVSACNNCCTDHGVDTVG